MKPVLNLKLACLLTATCTLSAAAPKPQSPAPQQLKQVISSPNLLDKIKLSQELIQKNKKREPLQEYKPKALKQASKSVIQKQKASSSLLVYKHEKTRNVLVDLVSRKKFPPIFIMDSESDFWEIRQTITIPDRYRKMQLLDHLSELMGFTFQVKGGLMVLYPSQSLWLDKIRHRFPELNTPVSITLKDSSLGQAVEKVIQAADLNVILDQQLAKENISLRLKAVTAGAALVAIAKHKNLKIHEQNGVLIIER
jgi:hypothetical protein